MTHNDVLRRLRYLLDYNDAQMVAVFAEADHTVTLDQVRDWLVSEEDFLRQEIGDTEMSLFLNGLINHKRGRRPGAQPAPETRLNNNLIVKKLKIALNLQGSDMIEILGLAGIELSNHELSAFFRKADHKHYRKIQDQVLRYFLRGLQMKFRPSAPVFDPAEDPAESPTDDSPDE